MPQTLSGVPGSVFSQAISFVTGGAHGFDCAAAVPGAPSASTASIARTTTMRRMVIPLRAS